MCVCFVDREQGWFGKLGAGSFPRELQLVFEGHAVPMDALSGRSESKVQHLVWEVLLPNCNA